jgi:hypothetical protein
MKCQTFEAFLIEQESKIMHQPLEYNSDEFSHERLNEETVAQAEQWLGISVRRDIEHH